MLSFKDENWGYYLRVIKVNTEYEVLRSNFKVYFKAKFKTIGKC
jgi:hypothetical protein